MKRQQFYSAFHESCRKFIAIKLKRINILQLISILILEFLITQEFFETVLTMTLNYDYTLFFSKELFLLESMHSTCVGRTLQLTVAYNYTVSMPHS